MLAIANFSNPLFWAVLIAWIMSVVLHEFAHGIVAYWGGDYTIRERGGLTLNPIQYVDPVFSILLPIVFLFMGGIPLPGASTYVRRDLLRSRGWDSAVSLAGPAMNFLLFLACAIPLHPKFGWLDPSDPESWTNAQITLGATATLQIIAMLFNLFQVPPLDGFQAISPWMSQENRQKLSMPPTSVMLFVGLYVVLANFPILSWMLHNVADPLLGAMGFDWVGQDFFRAAYNHALFGK